MNDENKEASYKVSLLDSPVVSVLIQTVYLLPGWFGKPGIQSLA